MAFIRATGGCLVGEITSLSADQTAEKTMADIGNVWKVNRTYSGGNTPYDKACRYDFLIFVQGGKGLTDAPKIVPRGSYVSLYHTRYAKRLQEFIEEHKLGSVWESEAVSNIHHKDRETPENRVYVWRVDHAAVTAWYTAYQAAEEARTAAETAAAPQSIYDAPTAPVGAQKTVRVRYSKRPPEPPPGYDEPLYREVFGEENPL